MSFKSKEKRREYDRAYWLKNKERIKKVKKKWQKKHLEHCKRLWKKRRNYPKNKYRIYKKGAETRGIEFNLTFEQFMFFWQKPCSYCGDRIEAVGLDRVDSNKGYILDNIVPCCGICNRMKRKLSKEEFINHCKKIVKQN